MRTAGGSLQTPIGPPDRAPDGRGKRLAGDVSRDFGAEPETSRRSLPEGARCGQRRSLRKEGGPSSSHIAADLQVLTRSPEEQRLIRFPPDVEAVDGPPLHVPGILLPGRGPLPHRLASHAEAPHRLPERDEPFRWIETGPVVEAGAHPDADRRPGHVRTLERTASLIQR